MATFPAGALGENLRIAGLTLADLAEGSVLAFPSGARLCVGGQNDPCQTAARELAATYGESIQPRFVRSAFGRRGVVGVVQATGVIRPGDAVTVLPPDPG